MHGYRPLFLLSLAISIAAEVLAAPAPKRGGSFVLSTGENLSFGANSSMLIRQGKLVAVQPLPSDVTDLLSVDEEKGGKSIALTLGRECPPDRRLSITHKSIQARLLVAKIRGQAPAELPVFREAVSLAPDQADIRLKLVRTLLATGQIQDAFESFSDGMSATPFEMAWLARQGNEFASLIAKLPPVNTRVALHYRDGEAPSASAAWSQSRQLAAFVDDSWRLHVVGARNAEVFMTDLALGSELDDGGRVIGKYQRAVANRVGAAEGMLVQLGFRSLPINQRIKAERNGEHSRVRWKGREVVASAGNAIIRVRQGGKVFYEEKIDTFGSVALEWGLPLPEEGLLLLAWSRIVGNDGCPNGNGISQVPVVPPSH